MRILLLGEYSNVHNTLAQGLRQLGHTVTVVSNGDFWKNYPRDIDVARHPGRLGGLRLLAKIYALLPRLRGYDVVQFINPMFFELKAERLRSVFRYLKKHNKKLILCGFGMDYYWVDTCSTTMPLRYSDFNIGSRLRQNEEAKAERKDWIGTEKERLNILMANECDAIVTGLYEYWRCYEPLFPKKTVFIPFPIVVGERPNIPDTPPDRLNLFIGISKSRSAYKGTDIMLRAAETVKERYPNKLNLKLVTGLPFDEYVRTMLGSDAIMDQLYSYTPSMNPLEAMAHGIICIGGGEPENYAILNETVLHPIINVLPTYESCVEELTKLVNNLSLVPSLRRQSYEYVRKHHDFIKVAQAYIELYRGVVREEITQDNAH